MNLKEFNFEKNNKVKPHKYSSIERTGRNFINDLKQI